MAPTVLLEHNDLPESVTKLRRNMCKTAITRERERETEMTCRNIGIVLSSNMHLITWSLRSDSTHSHP